MDRTRRRLLVLVIVHIAATIALEPISQSPLVAALSSALQFSQISLLAAWLAVGSADWPWRIGHVFALTGFLVWWHWTDPIDNPILIISWPTDPWTPRIDSLIYFIGAELIVTMGFLIARFGPPKTRLIELNDVVLSNARLQFSLRQVMALFVVVAVLLAIATPIHGYVGDGKKNESSGKFVGHFWL